MATLSLKNPVNEPTLKDHVRFRADSMIRDMDCEKQDWYDIATFTGHPRIDWLIRTAKGTKRPKSRPLYDGHGTRAFRYLESGMYSGLSSPNRPWFKFKLKDDDLNASHMVRVWLEACEQIVSNMLAGSNFYRVARANYGELGKFGNAAGIMDESWEVGLNCTALTAGEYAIATDHLGRVDTLLRICPLTTRQMVQSFVRQRDGSMDWSKVHDSVRIGWDNSNYNDVTEVYHLIEPNADYEEGAWGARGMLWRSVKFDPRDIRKDVLLEHKGYHDKPFWVPRWKTYGSDVWGVGPGHDALPDLRELQMQAKRKGEVTDLVVKPPTQGPAVDIRIRPGSHTALTNVDSGTVTPIYTAQYQAIGEVREDQAECKRAIDEAAYASLFMAISEREGVQPLNDLESTLRNDEKMTQLGPVIENVNNDMLAIVVDRAFGIALRGDLLPPPPDEIQGMPIDIEFVSVLAQAQKMQGMGQTERSLAFIGAVGQYQPDVVDMVDGDALVEDYWDRAGAPAVGLRDKDTVQQIRDQRAQQQRMQQMAAMAAPAKQGVEAAQLLNEMGQGQAAQ